MKSSLLDNSFKDYYVNEHYRYVGFASEIQVGKYRFFSIVDGSEKSVEIAAVNIVGLYYAISMYPQRNNSEHRIHRRKDCCLFLEWMKIFCKAGNWMSPHKRM